MMTTSAFEILGPVMVGPSSSHTAGALRIARVARSLAPAPIKLVRFTLYNSFARTYKGHGTDHALVAGILGLAPDDVRIKDAFDLAEQTGLAYSFAVSDQGTGLHPNTVNVDMTLSDGRELSVTGESVGGGKVRVSNIDGVDVDITGEMNTLFVSHLDRPGMLMVITGMISAADVNIATVRTYRKERGGQAFSVFEIDEDLEDSFVERVNDIPHVSFASLVKIPGVSRVSPDLTLTTNFESGKDLLGVCEGRQASIGKVMLERECELDGNRKASAERMDRVLAAMRLEVRATIAEPEPSLGGFLFGQASRLAHAADAPCRPLGGRESLGDALLGRTLSTATAYAMATLERSAAMGVIVASPTAGSAGVVPGALLACSETISASDDRVRSALWCCAAVGAIVARNASVSGAEGGCQAEVGTASAMAAAGLAQLLGATPEQCLDAAAIAIGNLLGLVCDPVRGLVEYPCQNRNAIGVANAFSAAQLSLSGVGSVVPFDEAVDAMRSVGRALPPSLRETALGGLAAAPSVCEICALHG